MDVEGTVVMCGEMRTMELSNFKFPYALIFYHFSKQALVRSHVERDVAHTTWLDEWVAFTCWDNNPASISTLG